ncbi:MAG TPA: hypothetical protein VGD04_07000 [Methylophilus sp.]
MSDHNESWEKFLNPETLKRNLIAISLFITSYEMFKGRVIEKPESFFTNGFKEDGLNVSEEYKTEVLALSKSKFYASLLWFKKMDAIEQSDMDSIDSIRQHRNEVAHNPMEFISIANRNFDTSKFEDLVTIFAKLEKWWFINFELAIDPDMLPDRANPDDVIYGPIWSLQMMLDIAQGNEPEEGYYYKAFKQLKPNQT